jgi:Secretion system C-terminal sorting domain
MTKIWKRMYSLNHFWLLSLLALFELNSAGAQPLRPYVPMAIEGAHWAMDVRVSDAGRILYVGRYHYLVHGDTIVQGRAYKKLYHCPALIGLLRDDTLSRKVLYLPIDTVTPMLELNRSICTGVGEKVLYDFNLSSGDSLKTCWKNLNQSNWRNVHTITRNDTITVFGKNRNVLRVATNALIDGIGNQTSGIFPHSWIFEWYYSLVYYNVLNVTGCTDPRVGSEEIQNPILEAVVFPNPTHHAIQITIPDAGMRQTHFSLCDWTGRILKKGVFEGNEHSILVDDIANGIYMLRLESQNQSVTLKTIILN